MRDVLAAFVDRRVELARFCEMLENDAKPILLVWGDDGIGKSSFLARLTHECSTRQVRRSEIFATKDRFNSYLKILRKMRDDLGADLFPDFTQLVNYFFPDPSKPQPPRPININISGAQSVLERAKLENVTIQGDVAAVIIKDCMINEPRPDMEVPPAERMIHLTEAFVKNLAPIVAKEKIVILVDDIQELTEETYAWLWNGLVAALDDDRLRNVRVVLCGRSKPQIQGAIALSVREAPLQPLELSDIENFLALSGHVEEGRKAVAQMLLVTSNGLPLTLALQLDGYFERFPETRVVRPNG